MTCTRRVVSNQESESNSYAFQKPSCKDLVVFYFVHDEPTPCLNSLSGKMMPNGFCPIFVKKKYESKVNN